MVSATPLDERCAVGHRETFQGQVIDRQALPVDHHPETDAPPAPGHETLALAAFAGPDLI
jgi:hypothetical protein